MKRAWVISDLTVDERVIPHWRMYAYADVLKTIDFETTNFFSDDSIFVDLGDYKSRKISEIKELFEIEKPNLAIVYTWCGNPWYLDFLEKHSVTIINRVDSDGRNTFKYHPYDTFVFMTFPVKNLLTKVRATKHWFFRYLFERNSQINDMVSGFEKSSIIGVASTGGITNFKKTMSKIRRDDLSDKFYFLPNPTSSSFFKFPVEKKAKKIIAIADWSNRFTTVWKNEKLLIQIARKVSYLLPDYEFIIAGRGSKERFGNRVSKFKNVVLFDQINNIDLPKIMQDVQILVVTSRREGAPIVVNEALAMGCTIVSTPLDGVKLDYGGLNLGTKSRSFSIKSFITALLEEVSKWQNGKIDFKSNIKLIRDSVSNEAIGKIIQNVIGGV